jgi:uncharacterized membrane protein (UPF0127 family)
VIDDADLQCAPPRSASRVGAVSRAVAVAVAAVLLAGCGGDDGGAASADGGASTSSVDVPTGSAAPGGDSTGEASVDCPVPDGAFEPFGSLVVEASTSGSDTELCLLLADSLSLRQRGLMEVTDLGPYDGMMFAYETTSTGGYWMRNTPMPLSIAWISPDGEVVATADMEPCLDPDETCPDHAPGAAYQWAIEVPQGELAAVGLDEGATVDVSEWPVGRD